MPFLVVEELTKRLNGGNPVVDALGFELVKGETFALVGPSGSGKTTTLRLIAGFERPDHGRIVLDGDLLNHYDVCVAPEHREIGFVFQDLALFPHLSVVDNVTFGLNHLARKQRRTRAMEMLDAVRIAHLAGRRPHELSGGEQQRVAIARAVAPRPRLILFDEPFASLDPSLRDDVRACVQGVVAEEHMTAILVTHDHAEAFSSAKRVGVMCDGRLEQVGEPKDLLQHPSSSFVAEFLGATDMLKPIDDGRRPGPNARRL